MATVKESDSNLPGSEQKPKSPRSRRKSAVSAPVDRLMDDDKKFQEIMDITNNLQRQLEHSWELHDAQQDKIDEITTAKIEAVGLAASRLKEIEGLQQEIAELQAENERLIVELETSEEERGEAAIEIGRLKEDLEDKNEAIASYEGKLSGLENTLVEVEKKAKSGERKLHEKILQLEKRIKELESNLKQRTDELHQANLSFEELGRAKQQLESKVDYLERTRLNLEKIHDSLQQLQEKAHTRKTKR